jgi:hypothetical protein
VNCVAHNSVPGFDVFDASWKSYVMLKIPSIR